MTVTAKGLDGSSEGVEEEDTSAGFVKYCPIVLLKVAQINYVSTNQLHCTANLNFGLMCKKAKYCWALSTIILFLFS